MKTFQSVIPVAGVSLEVTFVDGKPAHVFATHNDLCEAVDELMTKHTAKYKREFADKALEHKFTFEREDPDSPVPSDDCYLMVTTTAIK